MTVYCADNSAFMRGDAAISRSIFARGQASVLARYSIIMSDRKHVSWSTQVWNERAAIVGRGFRDPAVG